MAPSGAGETGASVMRGRTMKGRAGSLKPARRDPGRGRDVTGTLPRLWLLSDAVRLPDPRRAASLLPAGSAVIARDLAPALLVPLAALCRARRLRLLLSGDGRAALRLGAGLHVPDRRSVRHLLPFLLARGPRALLSVAGHGRAGVARARRLRADALLLSPAFATGSHPGAPALGPLRWAAIARRAGTPPVALGGLDCLRARRLPPVARGWAAIRGLAGGCVTPATVSHGCRARASAAVDGATRPNA